MLNLLGTLLLIVAVLITIALWCTYRAVYVDKKGRERKLFLTKHESYDNKIHYYGEFHQEGFLDDPGVDDEIYLSDASKQSKTIRTVLTIVIWAIYILVTMNLGGGDEASNPMLHTY